jgi:hypothetical protein
MAHKKPNRGQRTDTHKKTIKKPMRKPVNKPTKKK